MLWGGREDGMFQDHKGGKGGCSTEVESGKKGGLKCRWSENPCSREDKESA